MPETAAIASALTGNPAPAGRLFATRTTAIVGSGHAGANPLARTA